MFPGLFSERRRRCNLRHLGNDRRRATGIPAVRWWAGEELNRPTSRLSSVCSGAELPARGQGRRDEALSKTTRPLSDRTVFTMLRSGHRFAGGFARFRVGRV